MFKVVCADKQIVSLEDILAMMNRDVHMNLKRAVEHGRWHDGRKLSAEQLEYCLQAIIAYEQQHLPESMRVGYIDRSGLKKTQCDDHDHTHDPERVDPITIVTH
jgi:uncharacterized protein YeaC (DUF1315 family)